MMIILTLIALFSLSQLKESFGKDLDYVESDDYLPPVNELS
jgi:hypothetical protein